MKKIIDAVTIVLTIIAMIGLLCVNLFTLSVTVTAVFRIIAAVWLIWELIYSTLSFRRTLKSN